MVHQILSLIVANGTAYIHAEQRLPDKSSVSDVAISSFTFESFEVSSILVHIVASSSEASEGQGVADTLVPSNRSARPLSR